ncbi:MAG: DUF2264 domain-containing protein, partial [Oscillospiraceae bacterium]
WWMTQPIFDNAGILSVGYSYENMLMTEYYNASGSTYWGMKIFLPLALDENHPFWKSKEEPLPTLSNIYLQKEPRMVLSRNEEQNHIIAFTSGQSWDPENANNFAKYGKFAYSTVFGFSVSKGGYGLELGAYDSTIAVSRGDEYYRSRDVLEDYSVSTDFLYSEWKPWEDVDVKSWIIPGNPWHVRIHKIETKEALHIADGGFAIKRSENIKNLTEGIDMFSENEGTIIKYPWASSGAINLYGNSDFEIIRPEPCTNLLNPRTYIPTLKSEINAGTTILISGFFGGYTQSDMLKWNNKPNVDIHDKLIVVETENGKVEIEI